MHCEHEDTRTSVELAYMLDRIDATTARHRNIHDNDIRADVPADVEKGGAALLALSR
jgi:hypothetical protein